MVRETGVAWLLELSFTLYVSTYVPTIEVFTDPVLVILGVRLPFTVSYAVAPRSAYVDPCAIVTDDGPVRASVGGVWSTNVTETTYDVEFVSPV